ncbi:MAG: Gfo/Idh/MocA family oxidoreductase [Actinomycetota bacterium]|nr:Gfo/Idh/MocA family oxidoreductase [Actinomycetota bacterium]
MTVSVAVVGCGWWSTTAHLPAIAADPRAELVAVVDRDRGKRDRAVARFGAAHAFDDALAMLDAVEIDALVVATPAAHHFAVTAAALARGIPVLVEKPMVVDPAEGFQLLDLARTHGAELMVGYTFHHTPHAIRLRQEIADGRIGTVEHVSVTFASIMRDLLRGKPETLADGGVGFDMTETPDAGTYSTPGAGGGQAHGQLTHSAALALHLTGLEPARVSAVTAAFELDVDLADALAVEFSSGAVGALDSAGMVLPGQEEILQCRIFGSAGHIQLDAIAGRASIHGPGGAVEELPPLAGDDLYPHGAPVASLIRLALGEGPNLAPGELGQQVVLLLDAALRSAREHRAIDIRRRG